MKNKKGFTLTSSMIIVIMLMLIVVIILSFNLTKTSNYANSKLFQINQLSYNNDCQTTRFFCERVIKDCGKYSISEVEIEDELRCDEKEQQQWDAFKQLDKECWNRDSCNEEQLEKWDNYFFMHIFDNLKDEIEVAKKDQPSQESISKPIVQGQSLWDSQTENKIKELHPEIRDRVTQFILDAQNQGIYLRVNSALRTFEEQDKLYQQGRTTPGSKVTNAKAGSSYHNYGLAFDVVEIKNEKALWENSNWDKIGQIGKNNGFGWGGDFKSLVDKPHFQYTYGKSTSQLYALYNSNQKEGEYVIIS